MSLVVFFLMLANANKAIKESKGNQKPRIKSRYYQLSYTCAKE